MSELVWSGMWNSSIKLAERFTEEAQWSPFVRNWWRSLQQGAIQASLRHTYFQVQPTSSGRVVTKTTTTRHEQVETRERLLTSSQIKNNSLRHSYVMGEWIIGLAWLESVDGRMGRGSVFEPEFTYVHETKNPRDRHRHHVHQDHHLGASWLMISMPCVRWLRVKSISLFRISRVVFRFFSFCLIVCVVCNHPSWLGQIITNDIKPESERKGTYEDFKEASPYIQLDTWASFDM